MATASRGLLLFFWIIAAQTTPAAPQRPAASKPAPLFTSPYTPGELRNTQAVVETTAGTFVIQLFPEAVPNHVGFFVKMARDGAYTGTIFHHVIKNAVIQGGDPNSKDPARAADYGQGGFGHMASENSPERHLAGSISTVRVPNVPNSDGAQFFITASDQPTLDGRHTVFGRVVDGLDIVQQISNAEASPAGMPLTRIEIKGIVIRDTPPEPFAADTPADLAAYRVTLETTMGTMEMELLADKAPETVRVFLKRVQAGIYDGIAVHRVAANFVMQTGAINFRDKPLTVSQQELIFNLPPEFNDTRHSIGVVSMARGEAPDSASTSFFICTGDCKALDGVYTTFARVVSGLDVLSAINGVPVDGETPRIAVMVTRMTVAKR